MTMAMELKVERQDFRLPQTLDVIRGNIVKYGNPLGLKGGEIAGWARDLNLPRRGEVLFYTGGEYQLVPYIDGLVDMLLKLDQRSAAFSLMMGMRNLMNKVTGINPEKIVAGVRSKERERFRDVNRKAALILQHLGVDICYLGEEELYSGALLYEFGFTEDLRRHGQKVADLFKSTGAGTIICLSPHAAEVFKLVYPHLVENFNYRVITFLEAVYDIYKNGSWRLTSGFTGKVAIHDSCRLARELGVTEEPREILAAMEGVTLVEPECNRRWTTCCGGPGKVLFPQISGKIAGRRVQELEAAQADVVLTFCPYCLAALDKGRRESQSSVQFEDFIEFLYRGIEQ